MSRRLHFSEPSKWSQRASRSLRESCERSRLTELQRRLLSVLTAADIEELRQNCKNDPEALRLIEEAKGK